MNEEEFRRAVKSLRERKERERQQQEKDRAHQADRSPDAQHADAVSVRRRLTPRRRDCAGAHDRRGLLGRGAALVRLFRGVVERPKDADNRPR